MLPFVERFLPVFDHYHIELVPAQVQERLDETDLMGYAGDYDGIICGDDRFSEKVLKAWLPRLKVIAKWGTGIDSIDQVSAKQLGIKVLNTPNAFTLPVADTVMGYVLAFARNLPWMDADIRSGVWTKTPGKCLAEQTLGVIGMGNIGKAIVRRAMAFGMNILGNDIVDIDPTFLSETHLQMVPLPDLLAKADFVSLNCDLNPSSLHLMNDQTIKMMKQDAVLINTARGPVIDEPALITALEKGAIRGAALDVFEVEPLPKGSPLLKMPNVLLGSHNSNSSPMAWERVHWNTIRNLLIGLEIPCPDLGEIRKITR